MGNWFLNPWALWIAGGVLPTLLILYFLKLRRKQETVPSTLLWKRAVQDLQVNAPFQKLRKNLLLLLQMLVLSAGVIALARPILKGTQTFDGRVVLMIDHSASMQTVEEDGRTRLAIAKEQALLQARRFNRTGSSWLQFAGVQPKTQLMVVSFAGDARVRQPFSTNINEIVAAIEDIQPVDGPSDLTEAMQMAEAYMSAPAMITKGMEDTPVSAAQPATLMMFTDGVIASAAESVSRAGRIVWYTIGAASDNVGITAFRTRRDYENPEILQAFVEVRNFGTQPVTTDLSIYLDGQLIDAKPIDLEPGMSEAAPPTNANGNDNAAPPATSAPAGADAGRSPEGSVVSLTFERPVLTAGHIEARLSRKDGFTLDNTAHAIIPAPRKLRVLLVTAKNWLLDQVLAGLPLEKVDTITPATYEAAPAGQLDQDGQSRYDVVILDKHATKRLPVGNYLCINTVPEGLKIETAGESDDYRLIWWDETHPVMRYVDLDFVAVQKGMKLATPPEAEKLSESNVGPAMVHIANDGRHYVIVGFAIENSDFPRKVAFPVFIYNAIRFLSSGGVAESDVRLRPGDALRVQLPAGSSAAELKLPGGRTATARADAAGVARFGGTERVGVYEALAGGKQIDRFAVNLEDPDESSIAPRAAPAFGGVDVQQGEMLKASTPEIWRWFAGIALVILLVEWWVYTRRATI